MNKLLLILSNVTSNNVIDSAADNDGVIILPTPKDNRAEILEAAFTIGLIILAIIIFLIITRKNKSKKENN